MPRKHIERTLQLNLIAWFNHLFVKKYKLLKFTMGGAHDFGPRKGAQLKALGLRAGTPDLFLSMMRGGYGGLYIELKAPDGTTSKVQKEMHAQLIDEGYCVKTMKDFDLCIELIMKYIGGEIRREGFP